MIDPFAAAQVGNVAPVNGTQVAGALTPAPVATIERPAPTDPFVSATDLDDPFATQSDLRGGGDFVPSPGMETLAGRLVVMMPRKYDGAARDPFAIDPGATREQYTVDLYVLNGGRMSYFYKVKGDPERGTMDEMREWVVEDMTPASPFAIEGYWVAQGGIVGLLKACHRSGQPLLGVPTMVPTKADREKGVTNAQVQNAVAQWEATGRKTQRPRYTWTVADPASQVRPLAVQWWQSVRTSIAPINIASAPPKGR